MKVDFKKQAQADLQRLLDKLFAGYKPEKVILFGSYAYGNPTRDSDLDLFIIKETSLTLFQRRVEVRRICYDLQRRTAFQPLVATPEEWRQRIEMRDPFSVSLAPSAHEENFLQRGQSHGRERLSPKSQRPDSIG